MRARFKKDLPFRFVITIPAHNRGAGKRSSFRIEKRVFDLHTKKLLSSAKAKLNETQAAALASINRRFRGGHYERSEAKVLVEEIRDQLYKDAKAYSAIVFNSDNLKIAHDYLTYTYSEADRARMSDYKSAEYETLRAVEALEKVSIQTATPKEIQQQVNKYFLGAPGPHRRTIFKLRGILAWVRPAGKWSDELMPDAKVRAEVRHISKRDLEKKVLPSLEAQGYAKHVVLARVCFYLGCRIGESFALTPSDLREKTQDVWIAKQIRKRDHAAKKVTQKTKNKKDRRAFVFAEGIPALKVWLKIKNQFTTEDRRISSQVLKATCKELFPDESVKHLRWHDLRHCYAIRLFEKGCTVSQVALMIGDSEKVCQEHYLAYIATDPILNAIRKLGNKKD